MFQSHIKLELIHLLSQLLGLISLTALAFALVKWKQKKLRILLLVVFVVFGIPSVIIMSYAVKTSYNLADQVMDDFAKQIAKNKQPEPVLNTYYIDQLKGLVPDSLQNKAPQSFYTYYGRVGAWRFPLVYPYSINATNIPGNAWLSYEPPGDVSSQALPNIVQFNFDKTLLLAKVVINSNDTAFAIYHFWQRKAYNYTTWKDCLGTAGNMGYRGDYKMMSIAEYDKIFRE